MSFLQGQKFELLEFMLISEDFCCKVIRIINHEGSVYGYTKSLQFRFLVVLQKVNERKKDDNLREMRNGKNGQ